MVRLSSVLKKNCYAVVVNFGGQYAHMISRRIRELRVYTIVIPYTKLYSGDGVEILEEAGLIVLSGGPMSVNEFKLNEKALNLIKKLIESGKPILGICFGHQLIAKIMGGLVGEGPREYGKTIIEVLSSNSLFKNWSRREIVWMSHRESVLKIPENLKILALTENNVIAAYKVLGTRTYGVQFHPEVIHTPKGKVLLENFIEIAKVPRNWDPSKQVNEVIDYIKSIVKDGKILAAVSGGVDSTVALALTAKAVGKDKIVPILVDHGLFREGEVEEIVSNLSKMGIKPIVINARDRFLSKLWGVSSCEERRGIIGEEFARIFQEYAERDKSIKYLLQGTTYPDVVESGFEEGADRIKSHHNVAGLPSWLNLKVVEPLKNFYKDEVRRIGEAIGVPREIIERHPFPGPGLAVRVIGRFTPRKLEIVRKASKIVESVIRKYNLYSKVWQAFAVVGDDKWVGVKGDARQEGYIVIVRIVVSEDAMTADWARIPNEVLDEISRRITLEIDDVTLVSYAITSKPPSTIEPC